MVKPFPAAAALQRAIANSANVSSIATDLKGMIQSFNAGAERMLGYPSADVLDKVTPADLSDQLEIRSRAGLLGIESTGRILTGFDVLAFNASQGIEDTFELTFIRKDGTRFPAVVSITPLRHAAGAIIGYLLLGTDNSERKQYERSLHEATHRAERANSAKSEFLANMSHEIRTPLNAVIGLGYLLEHTRLSDDQRQLLAKIQFGGRALLGVINNVLDLSKIEAGEMSLENAAFDLPALVRDLGQMMAPQATAKGIELIVHPASSLPREVIGDESRLRQILTNLLGNSIKFTEDGHVEMHLHCVGPVSDRFRLRCTVTDTGIGIEPAAMDRLFTPFTQADASTTRRFGGTGLGLSIARRFVELMDGEIGVTSTPGAGSTFWIELPLRVASVKDVTLRTSGLRILIADAGGNAPDQLCAMTQALGWSAHSSESLEELLEIMGNTPSTAWPDVLIVDLGCGLPEPLTSPGELPPVIYVVDEARSYSENSKFLRSIDTLLVRPLTSSALFNAVNVSVSTRPESLERVLQSTNFDELHAQWLSGVRVLVVDDSDINLEVAQRILEKQGASVATCSGGAAALDYIQSHHRALDVVLMDIQMPILDGNEVARRIRSELGMATLPIMALTAGALIGERQRSLEAGMNDFVSKPFDPPTLIRKVRRLVEDARGQSIAMVILEGKPVREAAERLCIASIDDGVVQQMFGTDLALFYSLLGRVLREFSDLALPLRGSVDESGVREELAARTHKLKGSAGMIGANIVKRLAGAVAQALHEQRPAQAVRNLLRQLAVALTTLQEEAEPFLERRTDAPCAAAAARPRRCAGLNEVAELRALLEAQNLAAIDKFEELAGSLGESMNPVQFGQLQAAIDNLDFMAGAGLLDAAMKPEPAEPRASAA